MLNVADRRPAHCARPRKEKAVEARVRCHVHPLRAAAGVDHLHSPRVHDRPALQRPRHQVTPRYVTAPRDANSRSLVLVWRDRSFLLRNHVWVPDVYGPRSSPRRALGCGAKCASRAPSQAHPQRQGCVGARGHTDPPGAGRDRRRSGCGAPARRAITFAGWPRSRPCGRRQPSARYCRVRPLLRRCR